MKTFSLIALSCVFIAVSCADMHSPGREVTASLTDAGGELLYSVEFHGVEVIAPSELGIVVNGDTLGKKASVQLLSKNKIDEEYSVRGMHKTARNHGVEYEYAVKDGKWHFRIQTRLYDDGFAFRYLFDGADSVHVDAELSSFRVPANTPVWCFDRDSDWKMKTYAGWWTRTLSDSLYCFSTEGPVQGAVLLYELPESRYMALTEAALYDYSGMRYEAWPDASLHANFVEGDAGFDVNGTFWTPWRVVMLADNLDELVNSDIVTNLSPAPDPTLFADTEWIKPGRAVWSWWSDCEGFMTMPLEKHFVDAAVELGYEYTLLDEGWEDWPDKWASLKEICDYSSERNVGVWVWKHSDGIRNYSDLAAFLDNVKNAGVVGVKVDYMNGESKSIVDFDIKVLQLCAERHLLVDFHGCQKPTGEARTYPNELTREGIRGLELHRMGLPLPASHNVALVFTRCILGNADYTPIGFSRLGGTTYAHQLATAYAYTSPLTVVAEHVDTLLYNPSTAPMLPFIKSLPTVWDETRVLSQSSIGSVAVLARRKGEDWYLVALNGEKEQSLTVAADFLGEGKWYFYSVSDVSGKPASIAVSEGSIDKKGSFNLYLAASGGYLARIEGR